MAATILIVAFTVQGESAARRRARSRGRLGGWLGPVTDHSAATRDAVGRFEAPPVRSITGIGPDASVPPSRRRRVTRGHLSRRSRVLTPMEERA